LPCGDIRGERAFSVRSGLPSGPFDSGRPTLRWLSYPRAGLNYATTNRTFFDAQRLEVARYAEVIFPARWAELS